MANSGEKHETFALAGADASFGSRTKDIFASLETIAAKHSAFESTPAARRESAALMKPDPSEDEVVLNKSDVAFRVPVCVPKKKSSSLQQQCSVPGFKFNPSKWTAYDLSDVADGQMSEKSNQSAALEFIQMRRTGAVEEPLLEEGGSGAAVSSSDSAACIKHVFRKPVRVVASTEDDSSKDQKQQKTCSKRVRTVAEEFASDAGTEEEHSFDSVSFDKAVDDVVYEPRKKIGTNFPRAKGTVVRVPRVRSRQLSQSDSDSEQGEEADLTSSEGLVVRANGSEVVADSDNSDDDFSELAAIGPDSDDERNLDDGVDECYVSETGVVAAASGVRFSAENDDNIGGLDCMD